LRASLSRNVRLTAFVRMSRNKATIAPTRSFQRSTLTATSEMEPTRG
jgi:hypothetical protein